MPRIFISYRRSDTPAEATLLYERLSRHFRKSHIFFDIDTLDVGENWRKVIEDKVSQCDALIAVIGPQWLGEKIEEGERRFDDPEDILRFEIATALKLKIQVIPATVRDASVPSRESLPDDIAAIADQQALKISHDRRNEDVRRLVDKLGGSEKSKRRLALVGLILMVAALITVLMWPCDTPPNGAPTRANDQKGGLEYVEIPPGKFQMGCVDGDDACLNQEKPRHNVAITNPFWLSRTEVTVGAYERFIEDGGYKEEQYWQAGTAGGTGDPLDWMSQRSQPDEPVVGISWYEAFAYCAWAGGRLPTEAEWEYAARGGQEGRRYPWGNQATETDASFSSERQPVASFRQNDWGLYDVSGNVWEWTQDWYREDYYQNSPNSDPRGPRKGELRVTRGGSWKSGTASVLRLSGRYGRQPEERTEGIGFRCVVDIERFAVVSSDGPFWFLSLKSNDLVYLRATQSEHLTYFDADDGLERLRPNLTVNLFEQFGSSKHTHTGIRTSTMIAAGDETLF